MSRTKPRRSASRLGLADQLRDAIEASGRADHDLAKTAKVAPSIVSRFMRGERGLTLDSLDALCEVLGLRLVGASGGRRGRRKGCQLSVASSRLEEAGDDAAAARDSPTDN